MPHIYRYVISHDGGSAPRPYGGFCTLAICKPRIRAVAEIDDWIIGFRSRSHTKVVYVMQVRESLPLGEYWSDMRFHDRRPDATSPVPDNIYRPDGNGGLEWVQNNVHDCNEKPRDISGHNVLIGSRFWYFGSTSPTLPPELIHLIPYCRGHTVYKNRRHDDVENLERWLASWPCGIHGMPINACSELQARLTTTKATEDRT
ncbi:MAG: hypothetical protein HO274_02310 [Ferrovum myxofaciens]|uniref:Nmad2 family putative nucleotide modification protein n=1 Tax=Ferrovum myxofaciens TaxID=416213 RepID=UPI002357AF41|nr:hypothetical protein [Ferrovum myxofaciens]QKE40293.1 MAG: hypothetical protein HO274_02310 [Ferrovum myxofaciens]